MTARKSKAKKRARAKKAPRAKPVPPKLRPVPPRKAPAAKSSWGSGRSKVLEDAMSPNSNVVELCKDRFLAKQTILGMRDEIRRLRELLESIKE